MFLVDIKGTEAMIRRSSLLTTGLVGASIFFRFDVKWRHLTKTIIFRAGDVTKDKIWTGSEMTIPHEVLLKPGIPLEVGVYGISSGGEVVIPTIWLNLGMIKKGAEKSGSESVDPTPSQWEQMLGMIGDLSSLKTTTKENLVAAINEVIATGAGSVEPEFIQEKIDEALKKAKESGEFDGDSVEVSYENNILSFTTADGVIKIDMSEFMSEGDGGATGGYYIPSVDKTSGILSWDGSQSDMPDVEPVNIKGPKGDTGAQGKPGVPGYTPVKGVDYYTPKDEASIVQKVMEAMQQTGEDTVSWENITDKPFGLGEVLWSYTPEDEFLSEIDVRPHMPDGTEIPENAVMKLVKINDNPLSIGDLTGYNLSATATIDGEPKSLEQPISSDFATGLNDAGDYMIGEFLFVVLSDGCDISSTLGVPITLPRGVWTMHSYNGTEWVFNSVKVETPDKTIDESLIPNSVIKNSGKTLDIHIIDWGDENEFNYDRIYEIYRNEGKLPIIIQYGQYTQYYYRIYTPAVIRYDYARFVSVSASYDDPEYIDSHIGGQNVLSYDQVMFNSDGTYTTRQDTKDIYEKISVSISVDGDSYSFEHETGFQQLIDHLTVDHLQLVCSNGNTLTDYNAAVFICTGKFIYSPANGENQYRFNFVGQYYDDGKWYLERIVVTGQDNISVDRTVVSPEVTDDHINELIDAKISALPTWTGGEY